MQHSRLASSSVNMCLEGACEVGEQGDGQSALQPACAPLLTSALQDDKHAYSTHTHTQTNKQTNKKKTQTNKKTHTHGSHALLIRQSIWPNVSRVTSTRRLSSSSFFTSHLTKSVRPFPLALTLSSSALPSCSLRAQNTTLDPAAAKTLKKAKHCAPFVLLCAYFTAHHSSCRITPCILLSFFSCAHLDAALPNALGSTRNDGHLPLVSSTHVLVLALLFCVLLRLM